MLRYRRYRGFLVFSVLTVFILYHFSGSRSWQPPTQGWRGSESPQVPQQAPPVVHEPNPPQVDVPVAETTFAKIAPPSITPESPRPPAVEQSTTSSPSSTTALATTTSLTSPSLTSPSSSLAAETPGVEETEDGQLLPPIDDVLIEHGQGRLEVEPLPSEIPVIHWQKLKEHFPVSSTIQLPTGTPKPMPKIQFDFKPESASEKQIREQKLAIIKDSMKHSWSGYKDKAWMHDEITPVSGAHKDPFGSWGATLVDSLDTLWIMGMKEEFEDALKAVEGIDFTTSPRKDIPLFETTIRYLGGLIAAYDISDKHYKVLLNKSVELAEVLIGAFDTPNRMPIPYYYWMPTFASQSHRSTTHVVLAELGSLSVEFTRLSQLTGDSKWYDAVARITDELEKWQNNTRLPGLWPDYLDASGCKRPDLYVQHSSRKGPGASRTVNGVTLGDPFKSGSEGVRVEVQPAPSESPVEQPGEAKEKQRRKRQLDNELVDAAASSTASAVATIETNPECLPQGLASSSTYGSEAFALGAMADSTFEYLPKEYLLLGGQEEKYRWMYQTAMDVAAEHVLFRPMLPDNSDILLAGKYIVSPNTYYGGLSSSDEDAKEPKHTAKLNPEMGHLDCFIGGMYAMGSKLFDRPGDLEIGRKVTEGCIWAYNSTKTGIMPENFITIPCKNKKQCEWNQTAYDDAIDPYYESREQMYQEQMKWYSSRLEEIAAEATASPTVDAESTVIPATADSVSTDAVTPATGAATEHAANVPAGSHQKRHFDPRQLGEIDNALPASNTVVGEAAPSPVITAVDIPVIPMPEKPLSHEEMVQRRIEEDRLPAGMISITGRNYILRPEAIESVFYLYRITGDPYFRDAGWEMFQAINKHTRVSFGHSAIDDITKLSPEPLDAMESFWTAETLKYFYLLFSEEHVVSLDEWVLNTEAHPLRRPDNTQPLSPSPAQKEEKRESSAAAAPKATTALSGGLL